jgi:hypothetical protein
MILGPASIWRNRLVFDGSGFSSSVRGISDFQDLHSRSLKKVLNAEDTEQKDAEERGDLFLSSAFYFFGFVSSVVLSSG